MGLRFVLVAYFAGGFLVSVATYLLGVNPAFAVLFGFWFGGLGAGILAALYDSGRFPFTEPHDTF